MFNRVKFAINKILFQTSNKESFTKNKKIYNINKNKNKNKNFNSASIRKFSTFKPPNEPNNLFVVAAIVCGTLFTIKKIKS
jgi:hypothetical protein